MSAPSEVGVSIFLICLLVPVLLFTLVKYLWNQPLHSGVGYFFGIEVPAGFYDGPGRSWMAGYHTLLAALYGVWGVGLGVIVTARRWQMTPTWAGGFALVFVPAMFGFQAWARHRLGINPQVRPVALALESRRIGDYISWPTEALAIALVAISWGLLLRHARPHFDWLTPLQLTWVALGTIPGKMALVQLSFPLPAERTEEHYRLQDLSRRFQIRVFGILFEWFMVIILLGVAVLHGLSPVHPAPVWRWLVLAGGLAVWGYGMIVMLRGMLQLKTMGRDLRPAGSWKTPFGRSSCFGMGRAYLVWFVIWFSGILLLAYWPHR
jgi:hypothetical protein